MFYNAYLFHHLNPLLVPFPLYSPSSFPPPSPIFIAEQTPEAPSILISSVPSDSRIPDTIMMMMHPKMMEMWPTMGSAIASFLFVWAMVKKYCPYQLRRQLEKYCHRITGSFYPYINITFDEYAGVGLKRSEAYNAVEAYLSTYISKSAKRLKAEMVKDGSNMMLSMEQSGRVVDDFNGVKVWWIFRNIETPSRPEQEKRYYILSFHKRYRDVITGAYLEHVIRKGNEIRSRNRRMKLYTNSAGDRSISKRAMWSQIVFEHPATFETMALESDKKKDIIEDLETFSKSKEFYSRTGKAWKRGYLLYGPPGTGKSTMIAAMANYLNYDVYDLELTAVKDNVELRRLLIEIAEKSILVIEDIDCSLDLTGERMKVTAGMEEEEEGAAKAAVEGRRRVPNDEAGGDMSKVTLSGLLNFIDGLWSTCGSERLVVFTTNYVEKLDPALIRRGRMDKHIELSYCSFEGFKVFAKNYLGLEVHEIFKKVQHLMGEVKITPADMAENLMPTSPTDDPEKCLSRLVEALEEMKAEGTKNVAAGK
ncbi:hypothetical protein SAY86_027812 [Trapa natans]|uniref:AAA+ ATPase domain-containing protein n=1 Tax=Trapa natans TaxID=22666 RepID=A0AAN7MG48_TRANT|nr:hypothetical protein SAY86_027812 [Trapa natans]